MPAPMISTSTPATERSANGGASSASQYGESMRPMLAATGRMIRATSLGSAQMNAATEHLRRLAARIVDAALERVPLQAAMVVGSAARGDADFQSDLDLLLYVDELPVDEVLARIRNAVGGTNPTSREPTEHFRGEEFDLEGVRTEVSVFTTARVELRLRQLREQPNEIDATLQKILLGMS